MNPSHTIYLASASPRRRELLRQIDVEHDVLVTEVDESIFEDESAIDYVTRLAIVKAFAGWKMLHDAGDYSDDIMDAGLVIGADTCISVDEQILGKPEDEQHAVDMLMRLSNRGHRVYSAVAIMNQVEYNSLNKVDFLDRIMSAKSSNIDLEPIVRINKTTVNMRKLSIDEIKAYWNSGEPAGKAGAYAIQGKAAKFIIGIEGSYSSVMGLPLYETAELLRLHGFTLS